MFSILTSKKVIFRFMKCTLCDKIYIQRKSVNLEIVGRFK